MINDPNDYPKIFTLSLKEGQKKTFTLSDVPFLVITNVCLNIPIETTSFLSKPTRLFVQCQTNPNDPNQSKDPNNNQTILSSICIATLIPQKNEHANIQFKILLNETVEFMVTGPYQVDIIGYYSSPEFDDQNDEEVLKRLTLYYEEEEEEEEMANTPDIENEINKQSSTNVNESTKDEETQ